MPQTSFKTYILDLRDQRTIDILPQLIENIDRYFYNYNVYKESGVYTINLFEYNRFALTIKFVYTDAPNDIQEHYFISESLNALVDYNEFLYNIAEILQLIYSLFNSIRIYGIMEG